MDDDLPTPIYLSGLDMRRFRMDEPTPEHVAVPKSEIIPVKVRPVVVRDEEHYVHRMGKHAIAQYRVIGAKHWDLTLAELIPRKNRSGMGCLWKCRCGGSKRAPLSQVIRGCVRDCGPNCGTRVGGRRVRAPRSPGAGTQAA